MDLFGGNDRLLRLSHGLGGLNRSRSLRLNRALPLNSGRFGRLHDRAGVIDIDNVFSGVSPYRDGVDSSRVVNDSDNPGRPLDVRLANHRRLHGLGQCRKLNLIGKGSSPDQHTDRNERRYNNFFHSFLFRLIEQNHFASDRPTGSIWGLDLQRKTPRPRRHSLASAGGEGVC